MTRASGVQVALFAVAGGASTVGGLFWTGMYGVPHRGQLGLGLFVLGIVCLTIYLALSDEVAQPDDGPPQQTTEDQR